MMFAGAAELPGEVPRRGLRRVRAVRLSPRLQHDGRGTLRENLVRRPEAGVLSTELSARRQLQVS